MCIFTEVCGFPWLPSAVQSKLGDTKDFDTMAVFIISSWMTEFLTELILPKQEFPGGPTGNQEKKL